MKNIYTHESFLSSIFKKRKNDYDGTYELTNYKILQIGYESIILTNTYVNEFDIDAQQQLNNIEKEVLDREKFTTKDLNILQHMANIWIPSNSQGDGYNLFKKEDIGSHLSLFNEKTKNRLFITKSIDDYYYVVSNYEWNKKDTFQNQEIYKCDQIYGVMQLLKDLENKKYNI